MHERRGDTIQTNLGQFTMYRAKFVDGKERKDPSSRPYTNAVFSISGLHSGTVGQTNAALISVVRFRFSGTSLTWRAPKTNLQGGNTPRSHQPTQEYDRRPGTITPSASCTHTNVSSRYCTFTLCSEQKMVCQRIQYSASPPTVS